MTACAFPETVSLFPLMGIQAARRKSHAGGAWRLYALAKALDAAGTGKIAREDLRAYVLSLGASPRQWQRWITEARNNDLMRDVQARTGEWMLILPSAGEAAHALRCDTVGTRKVTMSAGSLLGKGWRARVWAGYEVTFNARPITRERLQKIANVSVSTQRYRDAQAGVIRQRNYAKSEQGADSAPMLQEYTAHKGMFVTRDGKVAWRLPDSRRSDLAARGGRGRARKANKTLSSLKQDGWYKKQPPLSRVSGAGYVRLFNLTPAELRASARKLARQDHRVRELYEQVRTPAGYSGAALWAVK